MCHFWRLSPTDVDAMPLGMRNEFRRYQNNWIKAQKKRR